MFVGMLASPKNDVAVVILQQQRAAGMAATVSENVAQMLTAGWVRPSPMIFVVLIGMAQKAIKPVGVEILHTSCAA